MLCGAKTVSILVKMWSLEAGKKFYKKINKNNPNWPSHFTPLLGSIFTIFGLWFYIADVITRVKF